jgi:hypothetical protein
LITINEFRINTTSENAEMMQYRTLQWSSVVLLLLISSWPDTLNCLSLPSSPNTSVEVTPLATADQSSNITAGSSTASSSPGPSPVPSPSTSPRPSPSPTPHQDANSSFVIITNQSASSPRPSPEVNGSLGVNGRPGNSCTATSTSGRLSNWDLSRQIVQDIGAIKANVFNFWQNHGPDTDFGGFHGERGSCQLTEGKFRISSKLL